MRKMKLWTIVWLVSFLVSCGGQTAAPVSVPTATLPLEQSTVILAQPPVAELGPEVAVDVVFDLVAREQVVVIDVREDFEYTAGHIPGAIWLPLGELAERTDEVPTDVPVILACRSGNRSGQAYQFLKQRGFVNIHNMTGGMNAWTAAGFEVEK